MPSIRAGLSLAFALASTAISAIQLRAQSRPDDLPTELRTDSVAWQRVLAYVVTILGPQIVSASMDPTPQPWDLRLPPDDPQRRLLESQLRTILHARSVTDSDSVVHTLELGPLRIVNDTARINVRVDSARRCPGTLRSSGGGGVYTVIVPRHPVLKVWGAARSTGAVAGDRVGC